MKRSRLKVYRTHGYIAYAGQCETVCATTSWRAFGEALDAAGMGPSGGPTTLSRWGSITHNEEDCTTALAEPGRVFVRRTRDAGRQPLVTVEAMRERFKGGGNE